MGALRGRFDTNESRPKGSASPASTLLQKALDVPVELSERRKRQVAVRAVHTHEEHSRAEFVFSGSEDGAQLPAEPVAADSRAERTPNGEGNGRAGEGGVKKHDAPQIPTANTCSLAAEALKLVGAVEASDQAESRWRPLRRRAFRTARPARVDMRARKPCFTDRRFLLG
ncbi:MAG: hypothetical protein RL391_34 [Actinomycetota bacterium]